MKGLSEMLTNEELIRIIEIFRNEGIDRLTGKELTEKETYIFLNLIDETVGRMNSTDVIFAPKSFGLTDNATAEEIAKYLLKQN